MRFKNPGGELSWLTPLLFLGGGYVAYVSYREGSTAMALMAGSLALLSLLVWLDMKWVAIPLIGWFSVVLVGGVLLLCFKEFSWRIVFRLGAVSFTIYSLWEWYRRSDPDDVDPEMAEFERVTSAYHRQTIDDRDTDPKLR
ncbi:MAG TPA: hypothetical protein VMP01_23670 [Pirellulaceae bacterium]|nr:hypothetical protein [Pirellulaceae bacterium]